MVKEVQEVKEVPTRNKQGYKFLVVWKNLSELRRRIYSITKNLPKSERRRISQMNDAARSAKPNLQEGYFKSTAGFVRYLMVSQGSLGELRGDLDDYRENSLITESDFGELDPFCGKTAFLVSRLIDPLRKKL